MCSKNTVVKEKQHVLVVDRLVLELSGKEGCRSQPAFGTVAQREQCVLL